MRKFLKLIDQPHYKLNMDFYQSVIIGIVDEPLAKTCRGTMQFFLIRQSHYSKQTYDTCCTGYFRLQPLHTTLGRSARSMITYSTYIKTERSTTLLTIIQSHIYLITSLCQTYTTLYFNRTRQICSHLNVSLECFLLRVNLQ